MSSSTLYRAHHILVSRPDTCSSGRRHEWHDGKETPNPGCGFKDAVYTPLPSLFQLPCGTVKRVLPFSSHGYATRSRGVFSLSPAGRRTGDVEMS